MTTRSLHDIFKDFQRYRVERSLCPRLAKDLIKYVDSIMNDYPVLGYLPVAQRKQFRKNPLPTQPLLGIAILDISWSNGLRILS